jgi:hypothetical protein
MKMKTKMKIMPIVAVVIGLVLLASAAFLAPRLFNRNILASDPGGKGGKMGDFSNVTVMPPDELPLTNYDLAGEVTQIKDNSIFISPAFLNEGEMEVVVNQDTKIYLYQGYETIDQAADGSWSEVKRKLEPITVKDIGVDDILSIWADKRGDRYIAKYISVLH